MSHFLNILLAGLQGNVLSSSITEEISILISKILSTGTLGRDAYLTYCFSPNIGCFFFYVSHPATFREEKKERIYQKYGVLCIQFIFLAHLLKPYPLPQNVPKSPELSSPFFFMVQHFHYPTLFKKSGGVSSTRGLI